MPKRAFCSKGRANDNTTASEWNDEMITGDCRLNFNLLSFLKNPPTRRHHYNPSSSILLSLCWDVTIKYLQPALNGLALFIQSYSPPTKPCLPLWNPKLSEFLFIHYGWNLLFLWQICSRDYTNIPNVCLPGELRLNCTRSRALRTVHQDMCGLFFFFPFKTDFSVSPKLIQQVNRGVLIFKQTRNLPWLSRGKYWWKVRRASFYHPLRKRGEWRLHAISTVL